MYKSLFIGKNVGPAYIYQTKLIFLFLIDFPIVSLEMQVLFCLETEPWTKWPFIHPFQIYCYLCFVCVLSRSVMSDSLWTMDYSPPDFSVYGILQARILEWVAMPSPSGSPWPRDWTCISWVSCIGRQVL